MGEITLKERFRKVTINLGPNIVAAEWKYFEEYARRFNLEENPEKQYGILIQGSSAEEVNMIYAGDVLELRVKHLEAMNEKVKDQKVLNFVTILIG